GAAAAAGGADLLLCGRERGAEHGAGHAADGSPAAAPGAPGQQPGGARESGRAAQRGRLARGISARHRVAVPRSAGTHASPATALEERRYSRAATHAPKAGSAMGCDAAASAIAPGLDNRVG